MCTDKSAGTLFVVATPIGNLDDCSERCLATLRSVDLIAAEDTRVTRKLLSRFDIHTPLTALHEHSSEKKVGALVARMASGDTIALVSDAGTPGISDPGAELVRAAILAGVSIHPIAGPSSVTAALSASGEPASRFYFGGFLPRGGSERETALAALARLEDPIVLFEAPGRLARTLSDLLAALGPRSVMVGRELTKLHEELRRGSLTELAHWFSQAPPRGECVIVLSAAPTPVEPPSEGEIGHAARRLVSEGKPTREVAAELSRCLRLPHRVAYRAALAARATEPTEG
jgi:16S rRNA (cytidine1402-2'-O)-methyltransferase